MTFGINYYTNDYIYFSDHYGMPRSLNQYSYGIGTKRSIKSLKKINLSVAQAYLAPIRYHSKKTDKLELAILKAIKTLS